MPITAATVPTSTSGTCCWRSIRPAVARAVTGLRWRPIGGRAHGVRLAVCHDPDVPDQSRRLCPDRFSRPFPAEHPCTTTWTRSSSLCTCTGFRRASRKAHECRSRRLGQRCFRADLAGRPAIRDGRTDPDADDRRRGSPSNGGVSALMLSERSHSAGPVASDRHSRWCTRDARQAVSRTRARGGYFRAIRALGWRRLVTSTTQSGESGPRSEASHDEADG